MGIMPGCFFHLDSRVGEWKSGNKVPSDPTEHALVLTYYYNNIYLKSSIPKKFNRR